MGVLNVTPDSSYDQGRWFKHDLAIERAKQIVQQGADILDIGGESTRPGAEHVPEKEELLRVIPVLKEIRQLIPIPISIDTMKPKVAAKALEVGATMINDVSGFNNNEMIRVAVDHQVDICVMHMHENPLTMQLNPHYPDGVIPFLLEWFKQKIELLLKSGVNEKNIILDPGIGFGKTIADNVQILQNLQRIKDLGFRLLIGLSRKSFLGKIINKTYPDLLPVSLAANTIALQSQVDIIRVHDVAEHRDVIDLMHYMRN